MSAASKHLAEIYRQLMEYFSFHTVIVVTPIKGNPPDQYEITYNLKGLCKPGSGDIIEHDSHSIELTIPFGFPHFPPSCKPKSNTFHPDFDPAAICLGDFWNQDCQLQALIIRIGQMINGEIYSTTNAFNEEASAWYNSHPDTFPLTSIEWGTGKIDRDDPGKSDTSHLDTLHASDFSMDFDFLALNDAKNDEDLSLDSSAPAAKPAVTFDFHLLHLLEKQRKFFEIREILKATDNGSGEMQQLAIKVEENIRKATDLHREAKKLEKLGKRSEALAACDQLALITADYPEIETLLNRLRQTPAPLNVDYTAASSSVVEPSPLFDEMIADDRAFAKPDKINPSVKTKAAKHQETKHSLLSSWTIRKMSAYVIGGVVTASCICGYYYWDVTNRIGSADDAFSRCLALVDNEQFEEAEQNCEEALATSRGVKLFHRKRIEQLRINIDQTLQSERVIQGLNGKFLVGDKYHPKKDAETIRTFLSLRKEVDELILQENWQQASDLFVKILGITRTEHPIPVDVVEEVKSKQALVKFRMVYASAEFSLQNGKWQEAITDIDKAESLLSTLPESDRQQYVGSMRKMLAKSTFEKFREQGDAFFTETDWQKAIISYQLALSTIDIADALPKQSLEAVRSNIKRAELYYLIDQGNKAFGSGSWDDAIGDYSRAETFLSNHQGLLTSDDADPSLKKLSRVILQTRIVRDRKLATHHLENNNMVAAAKVYRKLLESLKNSSFSSENEFRDTKNELAATIQSLDDQIYMADKAQHLKDEYLTIFSANYPNAITENLVNPIINFTRDSGDKMIFKMQCTESGERPLTLILYYAFDKNSGKWELVSEQQ
jgi:ubiquitin-protein ligase